MDQQHVNTGMHPPPLRMRTAFALALACGMTLVSAASHAHAVAAGAARHAGHQMPAATQSAATAAGPQTAARSSATITYRRFTFDEPLANWREVNDTVRNIGGWRAYLKEVQDGEAREKAAHAAGMGDARPADKPNKDKP